MEYVMMCVIRFSVALSLMAICTGCVSRDTRLDSQSNAIIMPVVAVVYSDGGTLYMSIVHYQELHATKTVETINFFITPSVRTPDSGELQANTLYIGEYVADLDQGVGCKIASPQDQTKIISLLDLYLKQHMQYRMTLDSIIFSQSQYGPDTAINGQENSLLSHLSDESERASDVARRMLDRLK